jgi:hypothetical protein
LLPGTVAIVLVASCTTTTPGQATSSSDDAPDTSTETTTTTSTSNSDELPTAGAPKVDDPLDTSKFQKDPCLSLTLEQSEGIFGFKGPGEPSDGALGKTCGWRNRDTRSTGQISFFDKDPRGLSGEYEANEDGRWDVFEKLPPIEGYPAIVRSVGDDRPNGICSVVVGASDEIAFQAWVQLSESNAGKKDPCVVAADIAGEAIKTIKAG